MIRGLAVIAALGGGLALLAYAADHFVLGAARIARARSIPAVVVGAVVIGFGTSLPELLVSASAALEGTPAIAAGNVVGSNLANLTLVLGIAALILPLPVSSTVVRREAPLALVAIVGYAVVIQGDPIRVAGVALVAGMVGTTVWILGRSRAERGADPLGPELDDLVGGAVRRLGPELARTVLGLVGTLVGAQLLLWGAQAGADDLGLSSGFVGVTIVAVGTSLPELVTCVQSARRGETDLVVGNLVGSNIFNALMVGGVAILIRPGPVEDASVTGLATVAAVAVTAVVWLLLRTGHRITRSEGAALVVGYVVLVPFLA